MALATVESLASETRPDLSCLSCVIVCLSIPISSAISRMVESTPVVTETAPPETANNNFRELLDVLRESRRLIF